MKSGNLKILKNNGYNVPSFYTVTWKNFNIITKIVQKYLKDDILYAVRSSSIDEDEHNSSHAGEYKTFLNISKDDIPIVAKDVFNSYNDKSPKNAVIIQEMVDSDYSGVIFSASPDGLLNEISITVGKGLGENVVDDKVSTTRYAYNKDDKIMRYKQENESPLLKEDVLNHLITDIKKIKELFGYEVDVEFAIKDDIIYYLQARPITTLKFTDIIILDNSNIIESYPGISLPLTQSFVKKMYSGIFSRLIERLVEDDFVKREYEDTLCHMVEFCNGRAYYRIDSWYDVLQLLPFKNKITSIWQDMLGVKNKSFTLKERYIPLPVKLNIIKNAIRFLIKTPEYIDKLNKEYEKLYKDFKKELDYIKNRKTTNNYRIVDYIECYQKYEYLIMKDWDITLINDMYAFIFTHLAGKENKDILNGVKHLESMKPSNELNHLAITVYDYGINSDLYNQEKIYFISKYGDRVTGELKLETETFRTNPEILDCIIRDMSERRVDRKIVESFSDVNALHGFSKKAVSGIRNREISRLNRTRTFGLVRELFLNIGEELKNLGKIERVRDVFYLPMQRIFYEITDDYDFPDYKEYVKEQKELFKSYKNNITFSRLVFDGEIFDIPVLDNDFNDKEDMLYGEIVSKGAVTGEAIVINSLSNIYDVKDKIIVTESTDPGWVFLIKECKGIVTERGSFLSHTAIISRELNKPAIVNVKNATKIIKTGDIITIDSTKGKITYGEDYNNG